jgi:hypothetical protein
VAQDDDNKSIRVIQKKHDLINPDLPDLPVPIADQDDDSGTTTWTDDSTRIKFEDPFKNYELLSELAKHHQQFADGVQAAREPDPDQKNDLSNNFGAQHQSDFLPHPLLAGKPYFNGVDPKTTPVPSETMLTDSPEYNDVKAELKMQKALRKEKQLQNENVFNPKPDGP